MIRKIIAYIGISFVAVPSVYTLILYMLDVSIPKETKSWAGYLSDHFGVFFELEWGTILGYYSIIFLCLVLAPYAGISYAWYKSRGRGFNYFVRFGLFFLLQLLTLNLTNILMLLFNDGHATVKWVLFLLVTSTICAVIPDDWLFNKIKS